MHDENAFDDFKRMLRMRLMILSARWKKFGKKLKCFIFSNLVVQISNLFANIIMLHRGERDCENRRRGPVVYLSSGNLSFLPAQ